MSQAEEEIERQKARKRIQSQQKRDEAKRKKMLEKERLRIHYINKKQKMNR